MNFVALTPDLVIAIHDSVFNAGELAGMAGDKSLEGALARVENRLSYGLIGDVYDLAAAYAVAMAQGHCFNDANKRTAHQSMDVCLDLNGVQAMWRYAQVGNVIIRAAQRLMDEGELADWLRRNADA